MILRRSRCGPYASLSCLLSWRAQHGFAPLASPFPRCRTAYVSKAARATPHRATRRRPYTLTSSLNLGAPLATFASGEGSDSRAQNAGARSSESEPFSPASSNALEGCWSGLNGRLCSQESASTFKIRLWVVVSWARNTVVLSARTTGVQISETQAALYARHPLTVSAASSNVYESKV